MVECSFYTGKPVEGFLMDDYINSTTILILIIYYIWCSIFSRKLVLDLLDLLDVLQAVDNENAFALAF